VQIQVNGNPEEIEPNASIATLIQQLQMKSQFVAVECNRQLIPRGDHESHQLEPGDEIEIVTLVGGG
jgi:sulfur carrier protein